MRLTFIADLRSPIAIQWIGYFTDRGHQVQAISSYPVPADVLPGADVVPLPLVLAAAGRAGAGGGRPPGGPARLAIRAAGRAAGWVTPRRVAAVRCLAGPALVRVKRERLRQVVARHQPDVVHAMRIPFEGIAAAALAGARVIVSVWGNDLTLFAGRTPMMASATRRALAAASVLHCDCQRDSRVARAWGFPRDRQVWVIPGNGGVDASVFRPGPSDLRRRLGIPERAPVILNPRGIREYVRTDVFFRALAPVLASAPRAHVVCPGMAGSRHALRMLAQARLDQARVHLLPPLSRAGMADAFRASRVSVSLAEHDGTPNTLLEAMACGALPVVGDVASVREWVRDGVNGIVVPPADPAAVASALMRALADESLARSARPENLRLVAARADYQRNMRDVESRYEALARSRTAGG